MKNLIRGGAVIIAACFVNACSNEQQTENTVFETYTAEQFFKTTWVNGSSINHDATAVLVSSDETGIFNVYKMPMDGSAPEALTASTKESTYGIGWFPTDDRILFTADQGGNELNHVFVRELDGTVKDLTPGDNLKAAFSRWHEDRTQFYISTNERDPKFYDIYLYQANDYSRQMVFQNNGGYAVNGVSPDGKWIVVRKSHGNADSDLFLINMSEPDAAPLLMTDHKGEVAHSMQSFTPDSKNIIYATNEFGEFNQAWSYNIATGDKKVHFKADWDVSFTYYSQDGKFQVTGVNEDAQTKLEITNAATGEKVALPDMPKGDLRGVAFSADSAVMSFYVNSDTSPSNLYVHTMGSDKVTRLTNSGNPEINEENLVAGEVIRFKSFDGLEIPAILYKPKQAATGKVPALVSIHGGPGGQSRKGYNPSVQHLVNNGYAIIRINNRGSSGYGKTFFHMDDLKHGDVDLKDVVYNKKYLQSLDWVDADKIGVMGGSYGGYLTMAAMTFTDEFKVGVNLFGVTNWVRTLKSIPPHWEANRKSLYQELGDPETDSERMNSISPVFFGHQVKSPVLVVQGKNDPRVLQIESDEMVASIREAGTHVEYIVFDNEGHGFRKKANRITAQNKYLTFLDEFLKK